MIFLRLLPLLELLEYGLYVILPRKIPERFHKGSYANAYSYLSSFLSCQIPQRLVDTIAIKQQLLSQYDQLQSRIKGLKEAAENEVSLVSKRPLACF